MADSNLVLKIYDAIEDSINPAQKPNIATNRYTIKYYTEIMQTSAINKIDRCVILNTFFIYL
ncbi:hypothetical protein, partial [Staphylococcus chromogenes]|uniref:hypothetical protein n=1 Tax=Staphylococcus chromogenes TaxID=46126 RepID=UPI001A7E0B8B